MPRERQPLPVRLLMGVFATGLAALLGLWSWQSSASSAALSASPASPRQNETVTLVGSGFAPGETVSVWITYPDFRVFGVAQIATSGDGSFSYPYLPDFLGATFTPTGRYTYTAAGQSSGRAAYGDINVSIGAAPGGSAGVSLTAEPGRDSQGSYFVFRGAGYAGGEEVALWLRYPDNTVADMGRITAGPSGSIEYTLAVGGAPIGRYALTGRGLASGATGIAEFIVEVDDLTAATGRAELAVDPSPETQQNEVTLRGSGFQPGEIVSIWVTLPDYSTQSVSDLVVGDGGSFQAALYLSEQEPVGRRSYTAYGNSSGLRAIADYLLQPGG